MKLAIAAALIGALAGCIEGPEPKDPGEPFANNITCPTQLTLTGGPYRFDCTLDFTAQARDVNAYSYHVIDANNATWGFTEPPVAIDRAGVHDGSVVFTVEGPTAPPLGTLIVFGSVWVADPLLQSRLVSTGVNVVAP